MADIKSLADQIRNELKNPPAKDVPVKKTAPGNRKAKDKPPDFGLLTALNAYDTSGNRNMVHVRFDEKTVRLMNQFKMATGVDLSKLIAYAVSEFIGCTPEIKQIIKHFIQHADL